MRLFTKSAFKEALLCPARLNYYRDERYANQDAADEFLASLAEGGFQVGELAKLYLGVPAENDLGGLTGYDEPLATTRKLIEESHLCTFAEGAFRFGDFFVRADVIRKEGTRFYLTEVKAKSWDPSCDVFSKIEKKTGLEKVSSGILPYVYDLAFQKFVITKALAEMSIGLPCEVHASLMMADKTKVAEVAGMNQCFKIVKEDGRTVAKPTTAPNGLTPADLKLTGQILTAFDVDALCDRIIAGATGEQEDVLGGMKFVPFVTEMSRRYVSGEHAYADVSTRCFSCPYFSDERTPGKLDGYEECWKTVAHFSDADFRRPLLEELWGGGNTRLRGSLLKAGKYHLDQIATDDLGTTEAKATGLTYVDRLNVQVALATNRPAMLGTLAANMKDGVYLDVPALRDEMSRWRFPLHMIDFETSAVALPFYAGMRPYEEVAFQFSHHVIELTDDGGYRVRHAGQFINAEKGRFPNFDFVRELKRQLEGDDGSVFRYSNHENTILNAIREQLLMSDEPDRAELTAFIETLTHRKEKPAGGKPVTFAGPRDMIDLCEVVKRFYYHPSMKGSNSIKAVLPAILNSSAFIQSRYARPVYGSEIESLNHPSDRPIAWIVRDDDGTVLNPYKLLPPVSGYFPEGCAAGLAAAEESLDEVNNGGAALSAYGLLQFSEGAKAEALQKALLTYCELDTMAMVFIWEYFNERINQL